MKKITTRRNVIVQTTENFAARTTVHGISYIFDPELKVVDRYTQSKLLGVHINLVTHNPSYQVHKIPVAMYIGTSS